jgi:hypothetical protein
MAGSQAVGGRGRRTGPVDEDPWWDAADQAAVERRLLRRRDFGRGWLPMPMLNNAERLDPLGDDDASALVRREREARGVRALDEGSAWRHRRSGSLAVLRLEVFATADDAAHRRVWREQAPAALGALFRQRWRERDVDPGWIEAIWCHRTEPITALGPLAERVDWLTVEDQTGAADGRVISCYEHVTVWSGRAHAQLTLRHDLGSDLDPSVVSATRVLAARLTEAVPNG